MRRSIGVFSLLVVFATAHIAAAQPGERAIRAIDLLRTGQIPQFRALATAEPAILNLPGPGGSTPFMYAAIYGDADTLRALLALGADPNRRNSVHATALMLAIEDLGMTKVLLDAGADPNARSLDGRTALTAAAGNAAIAQLLIDRGADAAAVQPATPSRAESRRRCEVGDLERWRDRALLGLVDGGPSIAAHLLHEWHAARRPPDLLTDAAVRYLKITQLADGHWTGAGECTLPSAPVSDTGATALAVHAMQLYGPPQFEEVYVPGRARALHWLVNHKGRTTEERAFRLLGVVWGGGTKYAAQAARKALIDAQRDDGGWSGADRRASCPRATGLALRALSASGVVPEEPEYQRGSAFIRRTLDRAVGSN